MKSRSYFFMLLSASLLFFPADIQAMDNQTIDHKEWNPYEEVKRAYLNKSALHFSNEELPHHLIAAFLEPLNKMEKDNGQLACRLLSFLVEGYPFSKQQSYFQTGPAILNELSRFDDECFKFICTDEFKNKAMAHMLDEYSMSRFGEQKWPGWEARTLNIMQGMKLDSLKLLNKCSSFACWLNVDNVVAIEFLETFKNPINPKGIEIALNSSWINTCYKTHNSSIKLKKNSTYAQPRVYPFYDMAGYVRAAMLKVYNQKLDKDVDDKEVFDFINTTLTYDYSHWAEVDRWQDQQNITYAYSLAPRPHWSTKLPGKYKDKNGVERKNVFFFESLGQIKSKEPLEIIKELAEILQGRAEEKIKEIKNRKVLSPKKDDEETN